MKGIFPEMSVKEYRAADGLNYSLLADFKESQDHALKEREPKSYFEFGTAFELLVQDYATGTNHFKERFFLTTARGEMPSNIAEWVETGIDLSDKYNLNKDGSRSKTSKRLHAWLDDCVENPGLMPMSQDEFAKISIMLENFWKMEVYGHNLRDLLAVADFQVPIFWEMHGIKKKGLLDVLILTDDKTYPFDIKTTANIPQFVTMYRKKYSIQDLHYTEGVQVVLGESEPMMFLASSKEDPFLAQPFGMDSESRGWAIEKYHELCHNCNDWIQAGKPAKGWKSFESIKIYY